MKIKLLNIKQKRIIILLHCKNISFIINKKRGNTAENRVSLYNALLKREEFKRPETKEIVLDEDEYLGYLEKIIQKDYFPCLYKLNNEEKVI
jgi:hypothetical protein